MPRIRVKLTRAELAKLTPRPDKKPYLRWDTELVGFGVLVSGKTGRKTYIVQQRNKRRRIAHTNVITIEEARIRAIRLIDQLNRGLDPKVLKREAEAERQRIEAQAKVDTVRQMTLGQVFEEYKRDRKTLADSTKHHYGEMLRRYCPDWLDQPLVSITRERIRTRHVEVVAEVVKRARTKRDRGHAAANQVLRLLRALWSYADRIELIPDLPRNPVTATSWYPETPTAKYIPDHQLKAFYEAVAADENTLQRDMVLLALFTGMRMGELSKLKWEAVDLIGGVIRQRPNSELNKSRRAWELPLSDYAWDLLLRREKERELSPYVFPALTTRHDQSSGSACKPRGLLVRVSEQTGQPLYNPHSLRHTYSTVASNAGVDPYWRNCLLNHSHGKGMAAIYTHHSTEEVRLRAQWVTDTLRQIIGLPKGKGSLKQSNGRLAVQQGQFPNGVYPAPRLRLIHGANPAAQPSTKGQRALRQAGSR